jgi:hypothetical protein
MPDAKATDRELWKGALSATNVCLTPEGLCRLLERSSPELASARAHLSDCPRCQTELMFLKEFQSGATQAEEAAEVSWITAVLERRFGQLPANLRALRSGPLPDVERDGWWARLVAPRRIRTAAFGLAAALLVTAVGLHLRAAREPDLLSDAARGPTVLRSEELIVVGPAGDINEAPAELRWQSAPGAAGYRVQVMEVDHAQLWETESNQTSVLLPAAVRRRIVPGKTLLWQVSALDAARNVVAASQNVRFRVVSRAASPRP